MCGNGENIYGIVAGLVAAAAILVMAFVEKHGPDAHHAHASPPSVAAFDLASPASVDVSYEGVRVVIDLRL